MVAPGASAASLAAERERAAAELAVARAEAAAATDRISELESASGRLDSELADTRTALEQMQAHLEALRGELKESRSALEERDRSSRQELESRLEETREQLSQLGARVGEGREEQLRAEVEATNMRLASFEKALAESDQRDELRVELDATRAQVAALEESDRRPRARGGRAGRARGHARQGAGRSRRLWPTTAVSSELRAELSETHSKVAALEQALAEDARFDELRSMLEATTTKLQLARGVRVSERGRRPACTPRSRPARHASSSWSRCLPTPRARTG